MDASAQTEPHRATVSHGPEKPLDDSNEKACVLLKDKFLDVLQDEKAGVAWKRDPREDLNRQYIEFGCAFKKPL
jgi:hypothetical protein